MDLSSTQPPPINNLCVPDIYNRLDAEVIERTRVANNQLNMRLLVEQKVIAKYRQEAERFRRKEQSMVARDLSRITQKLPAMIDIRDFDEKFFHHRRSNSDPNPLDKKKKKNYLEAKNDNPICHRCYIHHLPSKKRFYRKETAAFLPSFFETNSRAENSDHKRMSIAVESIPTSSVQQFQNLQDSNVPYNAREPNTEDILLSQDPSKALTSRLIPAADKFRFLQRDTWGREQDLNQSLTPRLMPNEIWKGVVKNVCKQCLREQKNAGVPLTTTRKLGTGFKRENSIESRYSKSRERRKLSVVKETSFTRSNKPTRGPSRGDSSRASYTVEKEMTNVSGISLASAAPADTSLPVTLTRSKSKDKSFVAKDNNT